MAWRKKISCIFSLHSHHSCVIPQIEKKENENLFIWKISKSNKLNYFLWQYMDTYSMRFNLILMHIKMKFVLFNINMFSICWGELYTKFKAFEVLNASPQWKAKKQKAKWHFVCYVRATTAEIQSSNNKNKSKRKMTAFILTFYLEHIKVIDHLGCHLHCPTGDGI